MAIAPLTSAAPVYLALAGLADCLCGLLIAEHRPVCWCGPEVGEAVSFDGCFGDCGDVCGKAWVRIQSAAPYSSFPVSEFTAGCRKPVMYALELGVMRCFPVEAQANDTETVLTALNAQFADERTMYRVMQCCDGNWEIAPNVYTPRGPEGGCLGGIWTGAIAF